MFYFVISQQNHLGGSLSECFPFTPNIGSSKKASESVESSKRSSFSSPPTSPQFPNRNNPHSSGLRVNSISKSIAPLQQLNTNLFGKILGKRTFTYHWIKSLLSMTAVCINMLLSKFKDKLLFLSLKAFLGQVCFFLFFFL